jgi:hypothetical protein
MQGSRRFLSFRTFIGGGHDPGQPGNWLFPSCAKGGIIGWDVMWEGDQMSDLEVAVVGLTNVDVMELKGVLAKTVVGDIDLTVPKEQPEPGKYHDPALVAALIKIAVESAPVVLPTLARATKPASSSAMPNGYGSLCSVLAQISAEFGLGTPA